MNDEYLIYGDTLRAIGDAIRNVANISATATPIKMAQYIQENFVKPTTRQAAKTYTPSTSNQTIPAGTFLTGAATIQGDADWVESNIKKGVNMWGKTGTLSGIWGDPSKYINLSAVASGSITNPGYGDTTEPITVTHNMGVVPKLIWIATDNLITYRYLLQNCFVWMPDTGPALTYNQYSYGGDLKSVFYGRDQGIQMKYKIGDTRGGSYGFVNDAPDSLTAANPQFGFDAYGSYYHKLRATATTFTIHAGIYSYTTFKWLVMG